jgi:arylsulfatase A-like enzyme
MLRSSVTAYLTTRIAVALICLPLCYAALVELSARWIVPGPRLVWRRWGVAAALAVVWVVMGQQTFTARWAHRQDRRIAENAHWVLLSSWWETRSGENRARLDEPFLPADLADFEPPGAQPRKSTNVVNRWFTGTRPIRVSTNRRPPNVVLIVLESVAARWTSLHGGQYETTPRVLAEAGRGIAFDSFYAHIGRSSNSLAAILLSAYPKLGFRDLTEEYPSFPGTSLAQVFKDRGYDTAFLTPSDLTWAGWTTFLANRGFETIRDYHYFECSAPLSSWGVEDRCMVDDMLDFMNREASRPFFLMAWSQQTHHPYEPTPGVPLLNLVREPSPDDYELGRYLNVLHETDRHLGRLFDGIRSANLDQDTLVILTGDHGQAFGYPHNTYIQGRTVYEEDVHVPLMFWFPRLYRVPVRSNVVGSHVDLAPTIVDFAGIPAAPDWQGRSLFDSGRAPRAYFYVAEDEYKLGVREGGWKYIFDLRQGAEELYDLERDPSEQHNLAAQRPTLSARLRQRLSAWTEANQRKYGAPMAKAGA